MNNKCKTYICEGKKITEKPYLETKKAVKALVIEFGLDNIMGMHCTALYEQGHNVGNVQNALNYFRYSPQAAKYRR